MNDNHRRMIWAKYMLKHVWDRQFGRGSYMSSSQTVCNGKIIPDAQETNDILARKILEGNPFLLLRPGSAEYSGAHEWIEHELIGLHRYKRQVLFKDVCDGEESKLSRWVDQFKIDLSEADVFSFLGFPNYSEQFLVDGYCNSNCVCIDYRNIGSWNQTLKNHWFDALNGKRVLWITPFVESFKYQWSRYDKVCGEFKCLPLGMDPVFMKSVWYLNAGGDKFDDWFRALDYLLQEENKISNFDIAFISCGPFSSFLAADIKRRGKQAISFGGEMQLLFGIYGNRWERDKGNRFEKYRNEYWIRPREDERVVGMEKLDSAGYW